MKEQILKRNQNYIEGTSFPEQFIYNSLSEVFDTEIDKEEVTGKNLKYNISVEELNMRLAFTQTNCSEGKERNNNIRRKYCESNSINYFEVVIDNESVEQFITTDNLKRTIYFPTAGNFTSKVENLKKIVDFILKEFGSSEEIDYDRVIYESLMRSKKWKYSVIRNETSEIIGTVNKMFDDVSEDFGQDFTDVEETEEVVKETKKEKQLTNVIDIDNHTVESKTVDDKKFNKMCKGLSI